MTHPVNSDFMFTSVSLTLPILTLASVAPCARTGSPVARRAVKPSDAASSPATIATRFLLLEAPDGEGPTPAD